MVIAGSVTRPDLLHVRPDAGFFRHLPALVGVITAGGDDGTLTRVVRFLEGRGLTVLGVPDVAPQLLVGEGAMTGRDMDAASAADAEIALRLIGVLGDLDVGQAVAVAGGRVRAIEGVEGTDRMLARMAPAVAGDRSGAAEPEGRRHGVLVKAPKPGQELRVDLPAIGPQTVARADAAGLAGIAVVAGHALALERGAMIAAARSAGLFIVGLPRPAGADRPPPASHPPGGSPALRTLGRRQPCLRDRADAAVGADVVRRLLPFGTGEAAAVIRRHVVAVSAEEGPAGMAARLADLRQWGTRRLRRRRGAFTLRIDRHRPIDKDGIARLVAELAQAGLAGLALSGIGAHADAGEEIVAAADAAGLFVLAGAIGPAPVQP
jgi:DUF1009 family protein